MSDKELPELEPGKAPLFVLGFFGLVGLFFVGLLIAVFNREPPAPREVEEGIDPSLKNPPFLLEASDRFRVLFETSQGEFVVEVHPEWAPRGATQFRELVEAGFYNENRFFRVLPNFVAQFGINGDPDEQRKWTQPIPDEPVVQSNTKGTMAFAKAGPNSRTTQLFINLKDNSRELDPKEFPAFGIIVEGMENVEKINAEYCEQPAQSGIEQGGNAYLNNHFPRLDYIKSAKVLREKPDKTR
jgi:cyclophilin family peptidyl-prolyl cis-trans isomerase